MKKRLISFLLTLVLLVALPLEAAYRYNPYTRKLDYYEAAGDITLGDIGDITLTGLATGNILYYNGTAWVNLATGANTNVLTLAAGIPSWAAPGAPAAHAATHLAAGADSVDHDLLLNYLAAQHLTLPNTLAAVLTDHNAAAHVALGFLALPSTIAAVLTDHNKAAHDALLIDADTVDGEHAAAIVTNARVKAHFPDTIANVLSDHNLLAHTALGLFDQSSDVDHNATTNYAANQHVVLPATIAAVLTDHNLLAHTALGLFDQSADVDHDLTTNYVANQHINWTAAADDFSTSEDFFLAWTEAADHATITQTSVAGIENVPLIYIADDRTGATVDEAIEATLRINADGPVYGLYIQDGAFRNEQLSELAGDVEFNEDIDVNWADAADRMRIIQGNAAGIAGQALIYVQDDRTGATADEADEATLHIANESPNEWAFFAADGKVQWGGNVLWSWASAVDNAQITQAAVAGIEDVPLINIDDDRTGATANELSEATIYLDAAGIYAFNVAAGQAYFQGDTTQIEDVFVTWGEAADHMVIAQNAVAGTEGQPLIFIDDNRVGATVSDKSEATIYIETLANRALYITSGYGIELDGNAGLDSAGPIVARGYFQWSSSSTVKWHTSFDTNAAQEDLLVFRYVAAANDSAAIFLSQLDPAGMTDHNNYESPTFVFTNDEGADANDYAGVVIGERGQANVKVAHYFDFYAMTGASDGSVVSADELPAIFRFGPNGTGVPDMATTGGDVLFEGAIEVDGNAFVEGYHRSKTVFWQESFDHGTTAVKYTQTWDVASLNTQGNGTNDISTTPGHITLTTDNNAIGDNEGTRPDEAIINRARENRSEIGLDLGQTANTQFYFGWNTSGTNAMVAAADEYVIVFFDVSDNPNWQIKVGDGATEDVFTSAVAANTNHVCLEIWVETDGTVHFAIEHTEIDITGSVDNLMTASDHYYICGQAQSVTGAAAIVAAIDFVENEKIKDH